MSASWFNTGWFNVVSWLLPGLLLVKFVVKFLVLQETDISWEVDRTELYGENVTTKNYEPIDGGGNLTGVIRENEHFLVWMRVDARPTIRKLYG